MQIDASLDGGSNTDSACSYALITLF